MFLGRRWKRHGKTLLYVVVICVAFGFLVLDLANTGQEDVSDIHVDGAPAAVGMGVDEVALQGRKILKNSQLQLTTMKVNVTEPPGPHVPFLPNEKKLVYILSYQRSGSTFFGDLLFSKRPDMFFYYEPLDATYSAMFGTASGWNVPSNIFSHINGSRRDVTQREIDGVAWTIEQTLLCNMTSFPIEMQLHIFWEIKFSHMNSVKPYLTCIHKYGFYKKINQCRQHIKGLCGYGFSEKNKKSEECHELFWHRNFDSPKIPKDMREKFKLYDDCVQKIKPELLHCYPALREICKNTPLRGLKTVRASMESAEPLLEKYPNLRLIHLFREPKASVLSRKRIGWTQGIYEKNIPSKIAHVYCQQILHDFKVRQRLEKKYPGRIMQIIFDDFAADPLGVIRRTEEFLDFKVPPETMANLQAEEAGKLYANNTRNDKWKDSFTYNEVKHMDEECDEFYNTIPHDWDNTLAYKPKS